MRTGENRESSHHIPSKYLVGGFKHGFYFPFHKWDVIRNPLTNSIIFSRWAHCTTNQIWFRGMGWSDKISEKNGKNSWEPYEQKHLWKSDKIIGKELENGKSPNILYRSKRSVPRIYPSFTMVSGTCLFAESIFLCLGKFWESVKWGIDVASLSRFLPRIAAINDIMTPRHYMIHYRTGEWWVHDGTVIFWGIHNDPWCRIHDFMLFIVNLEWNSAIQNDYVLIVIDVWLMIAVMWVKQ